MLDICVLKRFSCQQDFQIVDMTNAIIVDFLKIHSIILLEGLKDCAA